MGAGLARAGKQGERRGPDSPRSRWARNLQSADRHRRGIEELRSFAEELDRKIDLAGNLRLRVFLRRHKNESRKA